MGLEAASYHRGRSGARGLRVPRWATVGIVAVATVALAFVFGSTFLQVYRLEREAARLEQLKRDLEAQNAQLREEIRLLHTPQYIEKVAREQLGLVKPDEISLLLVQTPPDAPPRRPASDGPGQRPAPNDAGQGSPAPSPGWAGRMWDALRSLLHL